MRNRKHVPEIIISVLFQPLKHSTPLTTLQELSLDGQLLMGNRTAVTAKVGVGVH